MLAGALFAFVVMDPTIISEEHAPFFFLYAFLAAGHWQLWVTVRENELAPNATVLVVGLMAILATVGIVAAHFVKQPYLGTLFLLLYAAAGYCVLRTLRAAREEPTSTPTVALLQSTAFAVMLLVTGLYALRDVVPDGMYTFEFLSWYDHLPAVAFLVAIYILCLAHIVERKRSAKSLAWWVVAATVTLLVWLAQLQPLAVIVAFAYAVVVFFFRRDPSLAGVKS
jgi:uncharacterized membrane protein YfcA